MITPTALKFMKFWTRPVNMNRMPSTVSRLRAAVLAGSISSGRGVVGLVADTRAQAPSTADSTMTMPIR